MSNMKLKEQFHSISWHTFEKNHNYDILLIVQFYNILARFEVCKK